MFHVLLVLPVMAAFGVMAGAVLTVMLGLLCVAFFLELLLGLFCRALRWLLWLPVLFGVFGFMLSVTALSFWALPKSVIFIFWGLFGLMVLCGWLAACLLKKVYVWIHG
jgi:hypothetical protein